MNKYQVKFKSSAAKEFMEVIKLRKKGQVSISQAILKRLGKITQFQALSHSSLLIFACFRIALTKAREIS